MDTVSVAELKSRLSHYLREVRAGRSFTVTSRDIPVATLGPCEPAQSDDLIVVEPSAEAPSLFDVMRPPEPGLADGADLIRRDRAASEARLRAPAVRAATHDGGAAGEDE